MLHSDRFQILALPSIQGNCFLHESMASRTCKVTWVKWHADTDGDGTSDCNDECPRDPNKTVAGDCGCGLPDVPGCGSCAADIGFSIQVDKCDTSLTTDIRDMVRFQAAKTIFSIWHCYVHLLGLWWWKIGSEPGCKCFIQLCHLQLHAFSIPAPGQFLKEMFIVIVTFLAVFNRLEMD